MHPIGGYDLCGRVVILAAMLAMARRGAKAADLVVWWEEGFYARRTIDFALTF